MNRRSIALVAAATLGIVLAACGAPAPPPEAPEPVPCPRLNEHGYTGHVEPDAGAAVAKAVDAGSNDVVAAAGTKAGAKPPPTKHARTPYKQGARPAPLASAKCGGKDTPCPLQKWMRVNMAPALAAKNTAALAAALEKSALMSPDPKWTWAAMANKAAADAKKGDLAAARTSCTGCHAAYKQPYKDKFRTRAVK